MPPRKGASKSAAAAATVALPPAEMLAELVPAQVPIHQQVSSAIRVWGSGGTATVRDLVVHHLKAGEDLQIAETWVEILVSRLGAKEVAELFRSCRASCDDQQWATLGERFVEVVEVLEEERAMLGDEKRNTKGAPKSKDAIVIDEEADAGTKGLDIIKRLLVCLSPPY
jgi:hypothetical protein